MKNKKDSLLRYPGGKQRLLKCLIDHIPKNNVIKGKYIEPFIGGGAVYLRVMPRRAILSDINPELINLYKGIKKDPYMVWDIYKSFPSNKDGYYKVRDSELTNKDMIYRAARTLYLNRTCFKGMWRHNSSGNFNVGYGGESRRWKINLKDLINVSDLLKRASFKCGDFDDVISVANNGDFIFLDPPYSPGEKNTLHKHYMHGSFSYNDQVRLASTLKTATKRGVRWAMTNSDNQEILKLYKKHNIQPISNNTTHKGQTLIRNY